MYNNIKTPNDLPPQTDFCVFKVQSRFTWNDSHLLSKEGIEPKWEDPEHKVGGTFTLSLQSIEPEVFNKMWLHSVSFLIFGSNDF